MGAFQQLSSLSFDLRIKQAKNIEYLKSTGKVFVRYYLSAGNNKRIQLNTSEIPVKSDCFVWDESFSLECHGAEDCSSLKHESVVFELRWRKPVPVFGRRSSQLLGRAEIPWKEIFESPNMVLDKWVTTDFSTSLGVEGVKPAKLQVGIRVGVKACLPEVETMEKRRESRVKKYMDESCGCKNRHAQDCTCGDYDIFALAAALEAF